MTDGVVIPVHLTVHILGLTVASGLVIDAVARRRRAGSGWIGIAFGGILLAVTHIAVGALLSDDLAWPVTVRAMGYAALAVGAAGRVVGMAAVVAIAPPAAHIAAAIAGGAAALATARGVLGRGREVLLLVAGLALWASSDLVAPSSADLAAGLSVAGSVAAGGWLLQRARPSLLARSAVSSIAVLLAVVLGLASASGVILGTDLEDDELAQLEQLATSRAQQVGQEWPEELRRAADPLAGEQLTRELAAAADGTGSASLDRRAETLTSIVGVDVAQLVVSDGRVVGSWRADGAAAAGPLARADELALAGDPVVTTSLAGDTATGQAVLDESDVLAVAAVPVAPFGEDGSRRLDRQAGVLLVGRIITSPAFIREVAARSAVDAAVIVGDTVAVSTLPVDAEQAVVPAIRSGTAASAVSLAGDRRLLATAPVAGDDGVPVARIVLAEDAATLAELERAATRVLFWLAIVGLLGAGLLSAWLASRTTGPVRRLTTAAEQVAAGDLDVHLDRHLDGERVDEVGRLAGAFDDMTVALADREAALVQAAQVEAGLRARIEAVTGSMSEALVAVDRDGRITTANPAARAMLQDDLVGRALPAVLHGTDDAGRPLLRALGGPDSDAVAVVRGTVGSDRRGIAVAATAAPLRDATDRTLGRVYVLRDVSGEVEVERMKTEFLSNISHELRTPLTPIKGYSEVLRVKDVGRDRTVEFATHIALSAQRLERVIAMLVDFSALEAGRIEVTRQPTELDDVVDATLASWRGTHPDRRFTRRLRRGLPAVDVDPALLRRVLEELVDNAVKFSSGPVSLLAEHGDEQGVVEVTVRDRGVGIDADQLEAILRDFHQVDGSATRHVGGLGLGLAIVQRIIDRFDGDLQLRSQPGKGTDAVLLLRAVDR